MKTQFKSQLKSVRLKGALLPYKKGAKSEQIEPQKAERLNSKEMIELIQRMAPSQLTPIEIRRLMQDLGRHTLHTLISDATDSLASVRQLKKQWTQKITENTFQSDEIVGETDRLILCELSFVQQSWRLKIDLLQMIADAQNSLMRFSDKKKLK